MSLFRVLLRIILLPLAILLLLGLLLKSFLMVLFVIRPLRAAAEKGDADAQFRYGEHCRKGSYRPEDDAQAAQWFSKAAEQGHAAAQYHLVIHGVITEGIKAG